MSDSIVQVAGLRKVFSYLNPDPTAGSRKVGLVGIAGNRAGRTLLPRPPIPDP
jgi:hypothetical protein